MTEARALSVFELSTDSVPAAKRFELWRDTALRRLEVEKISNGSDEFNGRIRRFATTNVEFVDHRTDPIWVHRNRTRCRMDGRGDISVALVLDCTNATIANVRELTLNSGDLYILDYSAPVRATRPKHRELALLLPRRAVTDLVGDDLTGLSGRRLPAGGICALLGWHMLRTADAPSDHIACGTAIEAASQMALVALQTLAHGHPDVDQVAEGLLISADVAIARHYADPTLSPESIAAMLNCSRASLYRLFARRARTVAATVWSVRLEQARKMLAAPGCRQFHIGEIAFRCGFADASTFSRMFKRCYGLSPRDARANCD
jgi:AraC-like DNA-binding protein